MAWAAKPTGKRGRQGDALRLGCPAAPIGEALNLRVQDAHGKARAIWQWREMNVAIPGYIKRAASARPPPLAAIAFIRPAGFISISKG